MATVDDKLNNVFDIPASAYEVIEEGEEILEKTEVIVNSEESVDADFEYARQNLRELIERGQQAIDGIMMIALQALEKRTTEQANLIAMLTSRIIELENR